MIINKYKILYLLLAVICFFPACEIDEDEFQNLNNPTIETVIEGATIADLNLLAKGLESIMRSDMEFYYWTVSILGREYYDMRGTDPRYTGELLGAEGAVLDNNGFLTTRPFSAPYRVIRNANTLITAVENSTANLSVEGENAFFGFANMIKGYATLLTLNHQFENGCRLDVADPDNPGPFVSYAEGLAGVRTLFDTAYGQLTSASDDFSFPTNMGFDTPVEMAKVCAALDARAALYQGRGGDANASLANSFMDINGTMDLGAYHVFSLAGGDFSNPLFYVEGTDLYVATPDWINNIETDDDRAWSKVFELDAPAGIDDLSGTHQVQIYETNSSPVGIIRNEELLLIHAEANLDGAANTTAIADINAVRAAAGLGDYSGASTDAALMDEILQQRRYGLFGEGHRWIDLRRLDRLNEIVLDRATDVVHTQFPRPVSEGG